MGGGLWLTLSPAVTDPGKIEQPRFQIIGDRAVTASYTPWLLESPTGLNFSASRMKKVRLRILNLSPETDGYVYWRTADRPDKDAGPVRFTMRPDLKQWQDVVCHLARNIHVFGDKKSLLWHKHVVQTVFEGPKEAFG